MTMTAPSPRDGVLDAHDLEAHDRLAPARVSLVDRTLMQVGLALLLLGQRRAARPQIGNRGRNATALPERGSTHASTPRPEIGRQFC